MVRYRKPDVNPKQIQDIGHCVASTWNHNYALCHPVAPCPYLVAFPPLSFSGPVPSPDLSFQPDEHLEVYVSASENPSHFWIQILGVRSLQLDKLTEEMSRLYAAGTPIVSAPSSLLYALFMIIAHSACP